MRHPSIQPSSTVPMITPCSMPIGACRRNLRVPRRKISTAPLSIPPFSTNRNRNSVHVRPLRRGLHLQKAILRVVLWLPCQPASELADLARFHDQIPPHVQNPGTPPIASLNTLLHRQFPNPHQCIHTCRGLPLVREALDLYPLLCRNREV